jgi:hypothetical protein
MRIKTVKVSSRPLQLTVLFFFGALLLLQLPQVVVRMNNRKPHRSPQPRLRETFEISKPINRDWTLEDVSDPRPRYSSESDWTDWTVEVEEEPGNVESTDA